MAFTKRTYYYAALAAVAIALAMTGCATPQERAERQARTQRAVAEALEQRHIHIDITSMSTARYGTRMMSSGFFLEVKGDTLNSYLPYMGQVYQTSVFSTSQGLNFELPMLSYRQTRPKPSYTRLEIAVKTQEDLYHYVIDVFDSGKAMIRVRGELRDPISFDGDCDVAV
jgi:hypothetical protein